MTDPAISVRGLNLRTRMMANLLRAVIEKREKHVVSFLLLFGLVLRLAIVCIVCPRPLGEDTLEYHHLALSLLNGDGFSRVNGTPEAFKPPVFPGMVALLYALAGVNDFKVCILQAFIDLATCFLVWIWARRRLGSEGAAIALGLAVISMSGIGSCLLVTTECLATFLLTLVIVLFDLSRDTKAPWIRLLLVGLLAGLLTLTRFSMLLLPLFLASIYFFQPLPFGFKVRAAALLGLGYLFVLTPWVWRNYQCFGAPVMSTESGYVFYFGHKSPTGTWIEDEHVRRANQMPQLEGSLYLIREAWKHTSVWKMIRTYPIRLVFLLVPRDYEFIRPDGRGTWNMTYIISMILVLPAIPILWKNNRSFLVAGLLPLTYLCLITFIFPGIPRFRLPAEAVILPISAGGLLGIIDRFAPRSTSPA